MDSKIFFTIFLTILFSAFLGYFPQDALAACQPCKPNQICNPLCYDTFEELITAITNFIWKIALALAPLLIAIGGFYFVTASGDPAKIETGKNIIKYTLIALLIIFLAGPLVSMIKKAIEVKGQ